MKRSAGWQDVTGMAKQAQPALADLDRATERARAAWLAADVQQPARGDGHAWERFGLESILGAFLAGAIVGLVDRDSASHPHFRTKLEAIGYGFLVPVFFVSSGVKLDLTGLLHSPSALVRVPVFLLALLAVRGLPALIGLRTNGTRATLALGLLQATSLPFIVTATQIGVALGKITPGHRARHRPGGEHHRRIARTRAAAQIRDHVFVQVLRVLG